MQRLTIATLCVLSALLSAPALAQSSALPVLPEVIAAQFPAVGRIGTEGFEKQGCSATLIAPDLVVTAAHCLPKRGAFGRVFAAGWSGGSYLAQRPIRREIRHPDYAPDGDHSPENDVGLIILDSPITDVPPLVLSNHETGALDGAEVALVGYHKDLPDDLSGHLACPAINLAEGQVYVGCPVIHGNSGSPVLRQNDRGDWQVEAIISSRIGPGSIAIYLPDWLREQVAKHLAETKDN